jgi:HD-GYP domain-containing protein (c-di-GMP phosphodiesterase class II)
MIDRRTVVEDPALAAQNGTPGETAITEGHDERIGRLGPLFAHYLFSAGKIAQIHDLSNHAAQAALARLQETLRELGEEENRVTVAVATDLLSINDVRIVVDTQNMGPVLYLIEEMKKRRVEEIEFPREASAAELGSFLKMFFMEPSAEDVFGELSRKLSEAGVSGIRLSEWIERAKYLRDARVNRQEVREESNRVTSRAIMFMGEVMLAMAQKRPIQLHKASRITQQMADIIRTDETILVGLASIKNYDEYTFSHSVNVSVLSMLIADRMGLEKSDTAQIGVAALFHDVGKTHIPQTVLNKPESLTEDEWQLMERHPMLGVIELSRTRSLRSIADSLFVSLQHHLLYNRTGYPAKPTPWELHPFIHLVTIADIFDALTTPRVYRQNTLTPDSALRLIARKSGEMFDPLVVKVFIRAMGVYPVGTVVMLDTGEHAVVTRQNENCRLMHRPVAALLRGDGMPGEQIDLAETAGDESTYRRTIVRSVHDKRYEAQKASFFVMK